MNHTIEDEHLLLRIRNDDRQAFSMLYKMYVKNLYSYVHLICKDAEIAEEVVQQLFIKLWLQRHTLSTIGHLKSYLYRSAHNLLIDHLRSLHSKRRIMDQIQSLSSEVGLPSDNRIIYSELLQLVQEAISRLPEKRKRIVELRTQDGLSLDEIAQQLSISKPVVKKQLYTGMSFVRNYLAHIDNLIPIVILSHLLFFVK